MEKKIETEISHGLEFPHSIDSPQTTEYRGKKVLVTGHTGFKGTWLTIWLKALGANVIGYSLAPNTKPSIFNVTGLEDKIINIIGDIRDEEHLKEIFQNYKPEYVFHLAAQPIVRDSYDDPKFTYETNIMGLVNLFECIRRTDSVKVVVNVTSDKCYENKEWIWGYRENDPLGGDDPYSSSKACSEIITQAYRKSFFSPKSISKHKAAVASVRAGNVIGGGDWAKDRIIPDSIKALIKGTPIEIRNPYAIRPWQHVLEPLSGYLWLGLLLNSNKKDFSSAWNFCPKKNQPITVEELVKYVIQIWGKGTWKTGENSDKHPKETHYLKLECSKAQHKLNWQGLLDIEDTVSNTINWYKRYYNQNIDIYNLCLEQINNYIAVAKINRTEWVSSLAITS